MPPHVKLLLVDNLDSFTFMLADTLAQAGGAVSVLRPDALTLEAAMAPDWDGIVVSPGPGHPDDAHASRQLVDAALATARPFFGVCLGHQLLGLATGGTVDRVAPVHGKPGTIDHDGTGLFADLPKPLAMTRYHSLAIVDEGPVLRVNARSDDGTVMGVRHATAPAHGVQFHPESIASDFGPALCAAFVAMI